MRRARCKAGRRYASEEPAPAGSGGSAGNWGVCGSVWISAPGDEARAESKDEEKDSICRISVTLCLSRASGMVGGGMDHIRSAGRTSGMKRVMTGSDVTEEAVKSAMEEGIEQPVR